ncbi:dynamin family protein [Actinomadura madurae]|uniref:dynamin family protein n=1 Tax=Actinomadura madurae TaxID=1993 RepID=UPI00202642F6|nr:dynamin family protein [Actinomadura madurae]MCP9949686.1 dynamin family protein [Actinomadura madurae]MCP9966435.1 dynamin family protein [Actinomadura madurae]URN05957.1 dynamin family protein [Actinomadura madurae]
MTPPAEQSTVHDEEAGAGRGRGIEEPAPGETAASGESAAPVGSAASGDDTDASEKGSPDAGGGKTARRERRSRKGTAGKGAAPPEDAAAEPAEKPEPAEKGEPAEKPEKPAAPRRGRRRAPRAGETVRQGELTRALAVLRDQLGSFEFLLDVPGVEQAREARDELRAQLDDYVLPRIQAAGAPMLVVLGGSTGAGKSTLVNTLVGARVSATGVLRPTTSSPILVCHPDHVQWFMEGPMLPGMGRIRGPAPDAIAGDQLVIIASDVLPPGLALLDSPDFDSVFEDHYEFATKLMAAADLWLCVTTAARYADAQVWQMLQRAKENGATIGVVLSRVPQGAGAGGGEIVEHFAEMLDRHEVGDARRFTVPETRIEDSRLPEEAVEDIRDWLTGVAEDAEDREIVISDTLAAVLDSFRTRVPEVARQVEAQVGQRTELAREVEAGYGTALAELDEATRNGSLLRGEVLARWQDFAGTGDLLKSLHVQRSRRGRAANRRHRSPARVRALKAALRSGLESLIMASAEHGAEQVLARWRDHPAGEQVLAGVDADLGHVSPELSRRVTRAVSSWQDHVQELIRTEGVTKRSVAKLVSFDTEAVSLVLMIGLLGYGTSDVAVEGGNSAVPQRLLKALFGAESLRGMGAKARADLRSRIGMLFDEEAIRFGQVLDSAGIPDETVPVQLYQATYNLEVAR